MMPWLQTSCWVGVFGIMFLKSQAGTPPFQVTSTAQAAIHKQEVKMAAQHAAAAAPYNSPCI